MAYALTKGLAHLCWLGVNSLFYAARTTR